VFFFAQIRKCNWYGMPGGCASLSLRCWMMAGSEYPCIGTSSTRHDRDPPLVWYVENERTVGVRRRNVRVPTGSGVAGNCLPLRSAPPSIPSLVTRKSSHRPIPIFWTDLPQIAPGAEGCNSIAKTCRTGLHPELGRCPNKSQTRRRREVNDTLVNRVSPWR
jgi:hypothetical protein